MFLVEILLPLYDNGGRRFEVMVEDLDRAWWREYREELERRFQQEKMVVRSTEFEQL